MEVKLKPEAQKFVEEQIGSGSFGTPDEVVDEAIARMMIEDEAQLDEGTLAAIKEADAQFDRGESISFDEFAAEMRKKIAGR